MTDAHAASGDEQIGVKPLPQALTQVLTGDRDAIDVKKRCISVREPFVVVAIVCVAIAHREQKSDNRRTRFEDPPVVRTFI